MQVPVCSLSGEVVTQLEISDDIFAIPFNDAVVHQALVRQLANKRQGTASTKTRRAVRGSLFSKTYRTGKERNFEVTASRGGRNSFWAPPSLILPGYA